MKTTLLVTVLMLTVCIASIAHPVVASGQSNSSFGDFKITALDDHMQLNGKQLDKYLITYENSSLKVMVAVDNQKKCRKFYVLTDQLPVQYECNGTFFGVKKLDKDLLLLGYQTTMENLNKSEFFHQRVLTSQKTVMYEQLSLIASYYPGLFSEKVS
jgi:hypothetical protein